MKTPIAIIVALAALGISTAALAQQPGDAEELPVPEEKSVLVQPESTNQSTNESQLQPPPLLVPPESPETVDDDSLRSRIEQFLQFPSRPDAAPELERAPPAAPSVPPQQLSNRRLTAPAAPNLGVPNGEAPGVFVPPPADRGNGPLLVNPRVQIAPPVEGIAGRPAQVRIKDGEKRFPGAVPTTVKVYAPHNPKREAFGLASPQFVEVWVPPFAPREVKRNRDGSEVKLDFGDYEVEVHFRRDGRIEVDYDD